MLSAGSCRLRSGKKWPRLHNNSVSGFEKNWVFLYNRWRGGRVRLKALPC